MDKIIKDLTESTSVNPTTLVEIQHNTETSTKKMTVDNLTKLEQTARAAMDSAIIAGAGLAADGSCTFDGTDYIDSDTDLKSAIETLDSRVGIIDSTIQVSGSVSTAIVDLTSQDLTQLYTYPKTLIELGSVEAGQSIIYVPISAMMILYQQGNALSYGTDLFIGYDTGGDPAVAVADRIWQIPQSFVENSGGSNIASIPQFLPGAGAKSGQISKNIILWASTDHSGLTITSTARIVIVYKSVQVTAPTSST